MFEWLFEKDFMPHGHCYMWRPDILWMHVISDAVIALAYFSIPVTLLYFLRRRPDLPFPAMVVLFAVFIVLCGTGHLLEIWTVWNPVYSLQGVEKAATAVVSLVTAVAMIPIIPKVLAMRTPEQSQKMVDDAVNQLREAQARLAENEKLASLGAVVAGVAHEVSTPIGIGVTAASTLQDLSTRIGTKITDSTMKKSELERFLKDAQECSDIILKNLRRAADLMQSFKQVAVDQASGERRIFNMREYIDEVLRSLTPLLKKSSVAVTVNCANDLIVDSYPGSIAQIISNLVGNSLIHAFPDGRKGGISINVRQESSMVLIDYSDDGVGILPENLPKIFHPFFTTKRGKGGSGLGMHIVQTLTTQTLGGKIDVKSEVNAGTQFRIEFPLTPSGTMNVAQPEQESS